jgi:hypothetical protein
VGALGIRALWRHWDLLDRLADERDAFVIPEVRTFASRDATLERRHTFAALIHGHLKPPLDPRLVAVADELDALASELENGELELDPARAIACLRLLSDPGESPLLDVSVPAEELSSRVRQIRSGFQPRRLAARAR